MGNVTSDKVRSDEIPFDLIEDNNGKLTLRHSMDIIEGCKLLIQKLIDINCKVELSRVVTTTDPADKALQEIRMDESLARYLRQSQLRALKSCVGALEKYVSLMNT